MNTLSHSNFRLARWSAFSLLAAASLVCLILALRINAANPTTGTISPTSSPVVWDGVAAGGTSNGEGTCVEGVNCDTLTLTVSGTPGDWAGKVIRVDISWVLLASDYDFYIHKGDNAGPLIASGATGPPSTSETADIEPGDLEADGSTVFTVHVVYFAATAGDQYHGVATVVTSAGGATPTPAPVSKSPNWNIVYHGACCEGNLGAAGDNTFLLLPVLVQGNKIKKSSDDGKTWTEIYPPAPASVPFGIEGDMQAFGSDVIFFGTELAAAVVAHSDNQGQSFTTVQVPVASGGNDQSWSYLGPFGDLNPAGPVATNEPYVLAGWFRIGSAAIFSFDGGLTWPIQTPLVGNNGSGPEHVVCHSNAADPVPGAGDTRIANPLFANQKAGRHGAWGTDRKFYWTETVEGTLYTCQTNNFGVNWTGNKHPVAPGPGQNFVVTHTAFDNNGTLYVLHGNKLYVSLNQGKSFAFTHTLPRYGNAGRSDAGSDQFFVVDCGTVHVALLEDAGEGRGHVYYLRGTRADTAMPTWDQELVDVTDNVRLDFMQIVLNGNDIPTISYTTPNVTPAPSPRPLREVTTASRNEPLPLRVVSPCDKLPRSVVSRKVHDNAGPFNVDLLDGAPAIECRSGGDAGEYEIVFSFPLNHSVAAADVTSGAGEVSNFSANGSEVTVNLTGVANAQTIVLTLAGVNDGTSTGSLSVPMGVLLGDVNGNRVVTGADVNHARAQQSQPASSANTPANFRRDVNLSGVITGADVNVIRQKQSSSLP